MTNPERVESPTFIASSPQEVTHLPELKVASVEPDIPPHLLEAAGKAVDAALEVSSGRTISFGKMLHLAFGDELLAPHEFPLFRRAVNQDPRARYKGKGNYLI